MEDYKQRVLDERYELSTKAVKLIDFIANYNTTYRDLPELEQHLLLKQLDYMCHYWVVLDQRIALWHSGK